MSESDSAILKDILASQMRVEEMVKAVVAEVTPAVVAMQKGGIMGLMSALGKR